MIRLNPKFLKKNGKPEFVVLPYEEFLVVQALLEDLEDLHDLRQAKAEEGAAATVSIAQVIKTEEENEKFLAIVEDLMSRTRLTVEEDTVLELLVRLIEEFEAQHYAIDASTPYSRLLHLMESRDLSPIDLVDVLGSAAAVKAIIEDQTAIDDAQAIALGRFFHVNPSLLQY